MINNFFRRLFLSVTLLSLFASLSVAQNSDVAKQTTSGNSRPKVALVLGGGGAKGAAEVGVLKYIEQSGVPVDMIVGTSIGSIVGGLYSVGYRAEQLDSMFRSQEWLDLLTGHDSNRSDKLYEKKDGVTYVFGFPIGSKRKPEDDSKISSYGIGLLKGDSIENMLERMTQTPDSVAFDKLPIPYRCVAADINSFEEVVLSSGNLNKSMRASMAIPVVFRPVIINGRTLADGGMMNNLPVDVAKEMGADIVIAVDLSVNKQEHTRYDTDELFGDLKDLGVFKMLKWAIERPDKFKYKDNVEAADIHIHPMLKGYSATDFSSKKISEMIAIGEKAGEQALPELKKLKERLSNGK